MEGDRADLKGKETWETSFICWFKENNRIALSTLTQNDKPVGGTRVLSRTKVTEIF